MAEIKPETQVDIESRWRELELTCSQAIRMSETVAQQVIDSAPAHEVVKLLRRQADLSDQLLSRLSDAESLTGTAKTHGTQLAKQMKALLDLQDRNYRLLSRKGMRLSGPSRFSRSASRARP